MLGAAIYIPPGYDMDTAGNLYAQCKPKLVVPFNGDPLAGWGSWMVRLWPVTKPRIRVKAGREVVP